jgi:hypothetical protein
MAIAEKQEARRKQAVAPYLEEGEVVKASFLGQTPIPPWVFFLIASYVFIFIQKYRTVVATDRNIYVMHNRFLASYKYKGVAHKVARDSARIESGGSWVSIDGGPKLRVPPFGPITGAFSGFMAEVGGDAQATP